MSDRGYHIVKQLTCGVGDMDIVGGSRKHVKCYATWRSMIRRCFCQKLKKKMPNYTDAKCCDEWLRFSIFKKWFDQNHVEGWTLDKDILKPGNLLYSPENCIFVPVAINSLINVRRMQRGEFQMGVLKKRNKFAAGLNVDGRRVFIGMFPTEQSAAEAFNEAKAGYLERKAREIGDARIASGLLRHAALIRNVGAGNYA